METWFEVHVCDDGICNLHNPHKTEEAAREEVRLLRLQYSDDCRYRIVKCVVVDEALEGIKR